MQTLMRSAFLCIAAATLILAACSRSGPSALPSSGTAVNQLPPQQQAYQKIPISYEALAQMLRDHPDQAAEILAKYQFPQELYRPLVPANPVPGHPGYFSDSDGDVFVLPPDSDSYDRHQ